MLTMIIGLIVVSEKNLSAQGVAINNDGSDAHASAMLDIQAGDKGLLVPRIDITDLSTAAPVAAPAAGLLVYNTSAVSGQGYYYWNGSEWVQLTTAAEERPPKWSGVSSTSSDVGRSGKVGIGTTSPDASFHVAGDSYFGTTSGANPFRIGRHASRDALNEEEVRFTVDDAWYTQHYIQDESNANFSLQLESTGSESGSVSFAELQARSTGMFNWDDKLYVATNGNVGIGTTSPASLLHVHGSVRFSNLGTGSETTGLMIDGSGNVSARTLNIANWNNAYSWGDHATEGYLTDFTELDPTWDGDANTSSDIGRTGKVGIGTTSPANKLELVDGVFHIEKSDFGFITMKRLGFGSETEWLISPSSNFFSIFGDDALRMRADGTDTYAFGATGDFGTIGSGYFQNNLYVDNNVGIGTTSPSAKLHVSGNSYITTYMGVGAAPNTENRIYASNGSGDPVISGYNSYGYTSGMAGVSGACSNTGTGYLGYYDGTFRSAVYGDATGNTAEGVFGITDYKHGAGAYGEAPGYCEVDWSVWGDDFYATNGSAGVFGKGTETEGGGGDHDNKGGLGVMGDGTAIGGWFDGGWEDYMKSSQFISLMTEKKFGIGLLTKGNTSLLARGNNFGIISKAEGIALVTRSQNKLSAYHIGNVITESGYAQVLKPESDDPGLAYSVVAQEKQIIISGSDSFNNGSSIVHFDQDLVDLIDDANAIFVNITPTGFTSGDFAVISKSQTGFEVALRGGEDITFDYMVIVKMIDQNEIDNDILDSDVRMRIHQKANFNVIKSDDITPTDDGLDENININDEISE